MELFVKHLVVKGTDHDDEYIALITSQLAKMMLDGVVAITETDKPEHGYKVTVTVKPLKKEEYAGN